VRTRGRRNGLDHEPRTRQATDQQRLRVRPIVFVALGPRFDIRDLAAQSVDLIVGIARIQQQAGNDN
jgi:hypothetical protein